MVQGSFLFGAVSSQHKLAGTESKDPIRRQYRNLIKGLVQRAGRILQSQSANLTTRAGRKHNGVMATLVDTLANAIRLHQNGRLAAAAQIYRQILAALPDQPDALHLLGVVENQTGNHQAAVRSIQRAIAVRGNAAEYHSNLATAYRALGRVADAVAALRRAIALEPDFAEAHYNLGNALWQQANREEAIASYRRATGLKPGYFAAHFQLGNALRDEKKFDEAAASYRAALQLRPTDADALNNLGVALYQLARAEEAIACYRHAVAARPGFAEAHSNLGIALRSQGRPQEATACHREALRLNPDYAEGHYNLGNALSGLGDMEAAAACYRQAVARRPGFAAAHAALGSTLLQLGNLQEADACCRRALALEPNDAANHHNLGTVLLAEGKLAEAIDGFHRALALKPDDAQALNDLGNGFKDGGEIDEAVACYRRALELKPEASSIHSNLVYALQYRTGVTLAELAEAHAEFDRRHAAPLRDALPPHAKIRPRKQRLRLGFLSPALRRHPVGFFTVRVLENLDRNACEVFCYSTAPRHDHYSRRFQAAATQWREVRGMDDQRLAELVRSDGIDILFDLDGHTAGNLLPVFARKPAPVQATWAGYVGTTGVRAVNYLIADRCTVPPGVEQYYCERVLRMPDGYLCYEPPDHAPPPGPLPALDNGSVRFCSFNNPTKITPEVVAVWARILKRLPATRLLLKYKGYDDPRVSGRFAALFAAQGIEAERVELKGFAPHREALAEYCRVDVALDPFPYSGCTTTCDALWMGVPVVTCPGETFASRQSLSHLSNIGLAETIARDLDDYVELAVALAGDLPRLAALRAGLRQRMAASPLCDGKRFAANLLSLLQAAWEKLTSQ